MEVFDLIESVGLPIAGGLVMGYFIFLIMKQLMGNLVDDIKTVEGISKMLITRASIMNNDMIRIDTSVSSALNLPPDLDRIARAENFVEDCIIDALVISIFVIPFTVLISSTRPSISCSIIRNIK